MLKIYFHLKNLKILINITVTKVDFTALKITKIGTYHGYFLKNFTTTLV